MEKKITTHENTKKYNQKNITTLPQKQSVSTNTKKENIQTQQSSEHSISKYKIPKETRGIAKKGKTATD